MKTPRMGALGLGVWMNMLRLRNSEPQRSNKTPLFDHRGTNRCRRKTFMLALALLTTIFAVPVSLAAGIAYEDQVVRVHAAKREVDRSSPWQSDDATAQEFLGVVLPQGEVLTTAFAVADGVFLEVQRFGASAREEAQVVFVDYEVNLAIIKPLSVEILKDAKPLLLGDDLSIDAAVDIYKLRDAYQLSRIPGSIQEVTMAAAATSLYGVAAYALKVQQTGLGWSEPVLQGGKLVALTSGQDPNFLYSIPVSIIKHFLDDRHDASYRGFPAMGVVLEPLISPYTRRLLTAPATLNSGVRVAEVQAGSPFLGKLQVDDIVLAIEGTPVSEQGFISHLHWGKVPLKYLLNQRYGGDLVHLGIMRQGKEMETQAVVQRFSSNRAPVINHRFGGIEPHVIVGGLVFQELSQDYLQQWGKDWRETAPVELLFTLNYLNKPTADAAKRVIFLTRVLADPFNRGYTEMRHKVVATVNGIAVDSLSGLRQALARPVIKHGEPYAQITFAQEGDEVILGLKDLAQAHARIAQTYEVKTPDSFFTP